MPRAEMDMLRAGFAAFNRGDYESWIAAYDEDVEFHDLAETPDTRLFRGHDGIRAWLTKLQEAWGEGFRFEPRSFTEGDGVVVVDTHAIGTGAGSGLPIEMPVYIVLRFRNHKVVWTKPFMERADALQAAGLQE
ncbi:MAG: nuclear transport factor 2 family protein [Actinobacteria bacterium]|nr:MAG: nuclear transport factor 2 family protein [Actinomycetota bacterium]